MHKEIPYTEKSFIKRNPLYRDIPYVYSYIYIYIYINTQGKLYKEIPYKRKPLIQRHP